MCAVKLGEAIVYLTGNQEGIKKSLQETEKETTTWAGGLAGKVTKFLGGAVLGGVAAIGTAVVGAGAAAFAAGMQYDEAMDTIATSTGKTGDELAGLEGDFKAVFTSIPTDAGPAADVIGELNRRLGITGPTLQDASAAVLEMSRLLGGDAKTNAALLTRVMGDWGVANEDAAGTLDKIFKASQETGVGVEGLMQKVVNFGSPLRLMGFTLDESIALFAKWEQEGVNAELVMGSLRIAAGKFADQGVDLQQGLKDTIAQIEGMDDASAALALGMDVFGARAGPDMVAAIREGRFSIGDLMKAMEDSEGAIQKTADATADFPEKLQVLKNTATTALAPMGLAFMDVATTVVERLAPVLTDLVPIIETVAGVVVSLVDGLLAGIGPAGDWSQLWQTLTDLLGAKVVKSIQDVLAWFQQIPAWWNASGRPVFDAIVGFVQENLQPILAGLAGALAAIVVPAFIAWAGAAASAAAATIVAMAPVLLPIAAIGAAVGLLVAAWKNNWGGIQEKTQAVVTWIKGQIFAFLHTIAVWWDENGEQIISTVTKLWDTVSGAFNDALEWIKGAVSAFIGTVKAWWEEWGGHIELIFRRAWYIVLDIFKAVTGVISSVFQAFVSLFKGDWEGFVGKIAEAWDKLWYNAQNAFDNFKVIIEAAFGLIKGNLEKIWEGLKTKLEETWSGLWEKIKSTYEEKKEELITLVKELPGKIISFFTETDWTEIGKGIIDGVAKGITDAVGTIKDAARKAAQKALDAAREFLGISSPSAVAADQIGAPFAQGIGVGVQDAMRGVQQSLQFNLADLVRALQPGEVPQFAMAASHVAPGASYSINITYVDQRPVEGPAKVAQLAADLEWQMRMGTA